MTRREKWPSLMWAKIEELQTVPFEWGVNDCCMFSAKVMDAFCDGTTFAADLAQEYTTEREALQFIKDSGGIKAAVSDFLGESKEGRPQRGDCCLVMNDERELVGIFVGNGMVASTGKDGVVFLKRPQIICYWEV